MHSRIHVIGVAFAWISVTGVGACGTDVVSSSTPQQDGSGQCSPGDTRPCTGPGACKGGQACGPDARWGVCDCGTNGGGTSGGSAGMQTGSGGSSSGGRFGANGGRDASVDGASTAADSGGAGAQIGSGGRAGAPSESGVGGGDASACGQKWPQVSDACWACLCDTCPTQTTACVNCGSWLQCGNQHKCWDTNEATQANCLRIYCPPPTFIDLTSCLWQHGGDGGPDACQRICFP